MGHSYVYRVNTGGNFCGHKPENPRISLTEPVKTGKNGLPGVITKAMERMVGYYYRPNLIPSLNLANGSHRQQRSERREAVCSVIWAIMKYTDLVSLRVGVPTPKGFLNLTVGYLARHTGLPVRRVERALADLKRAGIVGVHPICERQADGSYKGQAAVKTVSKLLFAILGLRFRLGFERQRAVKRQKKWLRAQANKTTETAKARLKLSARAAVGSARTSLATSHRSVPGTPSEVPMDFERQRDIQLLMAEIKMASPTRSSDEIRRQAEERIAAQRRE